MSGLTDMSAAYTRTHYPYYAPQGVENVHTLCAGKPESDQ